MRLGLLGPAGSETGALRSAATLLRDTLEADRVIYLGVDGALDGMIREWAEELVGEEPGDDTLMARATMECLTTDAGAIEDFVRREKERASLRSFQMLSAEGTRAVEMLGGKVTVLVHDKHDLEEDDILPASILIFGKSDEAVIRRVGRRWFVSPGVFPAGGLLLLTESEGTVTATLHDSEGEETRRVALELPQTLRMKANGG